jgi:hypothetical protein
MITATALVCKCSVSISWGFWGGKVTIPLWRGQAIDARTPSHALPLTPSFRARVPKPPCKARGSMRRDGNGMRDDMTCMLHTNYILHTTYCKYILLHDT